MDIGEITKITQIGGRYSMTVSNVSETIVISAELLNRYRLKAGTMLTESQLEILRSEAELSQCDQTAARILGIRHHSISELRIKLKKKSYGSQSVEKTLKKHIKSGLLDDSLFAANWVRHKIDQNPMGRSHLIAHLCKKGIDRTIAQTTVDIILGETDELDIAVQSLRKRWNSFRRFDIERARKKAYTYLSNRGISYASAREAFDQLQKESEEG